IPPRWEMPTMTAALRRKASFLSDRPADAVDVETLQRTLDPALFDFLLDCSTYMSDAGRFCPGQRGLGERNGVSRSTANRRVAKRVGAGVLTKFDPGGRETCRYQVTERYRHAVLEARMRFRSDWWQHWRKPGEAAQAFTTDEPPVCPNNGTKGEA